MTKIIYFDVQDDEKEFLIKNNEGKYDYHLTTNSLNKIIEVKEEYKDAARVFHTRLEYLETKEEKNRAFRETVIRVKKNSLDAASRAVTDIKEFQKIIAAQAALQDLHISLD